MTDLNNLFNGNGPVFCCHTFSGVFQGCRIFFQPKDDPWSLLQHAFGIT